MALMDWLRPPENRVRQQENGLRAAYDSCNWRNTCLIADEIIKRFPGELSQVLQAHCLKAESLRALGLLEDAEECYRNAIADAEAIPEAERSVNEYFLHYAPRSHLALAATMRRSFAHAPEAIDRELRAAQEFVENDQPDDLEAQVLAVKGATLRQRGQTDAACEQLGRAVWLSSRLRLRYYQLWSPDQIRGHLTLVEFMCPGQVPRACDHARSSLSAPGSTLWTSSVSAALLSHRALGRLVGDGASQDCIATRLDECRERYAPAILLDELESATRRMGDPLLRTLHLALAAAWNAAAGRSRTAGDYLCELENLELRPPLALLRGCEMALVLRNWIEFDGLSRFRGPIEDAANALELLHDRLAELGVQEGHLDWCRHLLQRDSTAIAISPRDRDGAAIRAMRMRLWP